MEENIREKASESERERARAREMADFVQLTCLPDGVYLLTFKGDGEHRLNPSSMAAIQSALDEVENDKNSRCLITTNEGKFYSNGLDFAFIRRDMMELLFDALHRLLERFLHFPIPTMAAINGHAVAAGCMLALAHDYRFMRSDKGYIFLNEVEIKLPFTPGMNALIRSKLPVHTYHKAVLSGQRYGGKEAERSGIVDAALPDASSTQEEAIRQASALVMKNLDRATYKAMKEVMFKQEIKELLFGGFGELSKL